MKVKFFAKKHKILTHSKAHKPLENDKETTKEEFERCVICGAFTDIPVSMPIDLRENYEVGIGQICNECAKME